MRAAWYERHGAASEVLVVGEMARPVPAAGEVLVRLAASGVNPSDVKSRRGRQAGAPMPFPRVIPHSDGAGVVEAVGDGVAAGWTGQRVWIWNGQVQRPFGTAAQYIALPVRQVVPLPPGVSFEVGASLGIPALTAAHCVMSQGSVQGESVVVSGAMGTVGRLVVQMARHAGAARIIATARGTRHADALRGLGADAVVDFTATDLARQILRANGGQPVDRVIESELGVNVKTDVEVLRLRGRLIVYGSAIVVDPTIPFVPALFKGLTIELALVYQLTEAERRAAIDMTHLLLAQGALDVPVQIVYRLAACAQAHEAVERGNRAGSILVHMQDGDGA